MCKARIEKAAKTKGVKTAQWSPETQILTVQYNPDNTNTDVILQHVADVGHDNENTQLKMPFITTYLHAVIITEMSNRIQNIL